MRKSLEFLDSISLAAASTTYPLSNGIPNDYLMWGLQLDLEFRNVIGTSALTSMLYGSPLTFLQRITVEGNLLNRGNIKIFDMSGRQAYQYHRAVAAVPGYVDPDDLIVDAGATATYDIRAQYIIPFVSLGSPAMERATLLPGNMFSNPLSLKVTRGGAEALGINDTNSTQTFTSYGAGTGSPTLYVHRIVVKEGLGKAVRAPLLCQKFLQGPFTLTSTLTNGLIATLDNGVLYPRMHFLTGTASTDTGQSGELASGSSGIISNLYIRRNDSLIRNFRYRSGQYYGAVARGLNMYGDALLTSQGPGAQTGGFIQGERQGECLLDFCPDGSLDDSLDTLIWPNRGQQLRLYADLTGAANQQLEVIGEELSWIRG